MKKMRTVRGFTLVELLVVVLIIALLIAILLPSLAKAREAAMRMECSSRMRQIGLAVFQYEKQFGCMPNAQWNAFREFGGFMGISPNVVGGAQDAKTTEVLRCPSDEFLPLDQVWNALSYAPIVDSGYYGLGATPAGSIPFGNFNYCAWSYCRTGYESGNPSVGANKVWQLRNLSQIAPDSFILCEYWAPTNRLNPATETPAGYTLYDWGGGTTLGTICWGLGISVGNPVAARVVSPVASVANCGAYIMFSAYGYQAAQIGRSADITSLFHDGVMNIVQADGAVLGKGLKDITDRPPALISGWTRNPD
jgi:prepilin-type N-terminal cleavage/methylation domain-containing protein